METKTEKAVEGAFAIISAIDEAIKEAGDTGIPEGHLYAMLMKHMDLDTFNGVINVLKTAGRISVNNNHLIKTI